MSNSIQLLPDAVANQIAAGEVIQRPASVVKELIENAVDSGATEIKLIVKDAGKSLIQVVDNGKGMSETDLRLSIERHATSKIKSADDLFAIKSFGFRGEALASIAAIAHVHIKSKDTESEIGSELFVAGTKVEKQAFCQAPQGTIFSIKNLFFNTPARRKFLKSDAVEMRHIIDEFQHVSIANEHISFEMFHNESAVFQLEAGSFKKRIIGIFGKKMLDRLVPIEADTTFVKVSGYIGTPEAAKKSRGEQFFFVNNRFVKNSYLNYAVQSAFDDLIPKGVFPTYFIRIDVAPQSIDVNIHPTKNEVKFEDEKAIFAVIQAASREAIGKFNLSPSLDFNKDVEFPPPPSKGQFFEPKISVNTGFNPFNSNPNSGSKLPGIERLPPKPIHTAWRDFFETDNVTSEKGNTITAKSGEMFGDAEVSKDVVKKPMLVAERFIVSAVKSGLMLIEKQGAQERIYFENFIKSLSRDTAISQKELFPEPFELNAADAVLLIEILEDVKKLGIGIHKMGSYTFTIDSLPVEANFTNPKDLIDELIERYKNNQSELKLDKYNNLALSMAQTAVRKSPKPLSSEELQMLIDNLFACESPYFSPNGKPIVKIIGLEELQNKFEI